MKKFLLFFLSLAALATPLAADCGSCCESSCGNNFCCESSCCGDPCCTWWDGGEEPWGGFYIGGFGGYGLGRVKVESVVSDTKLDTRGGLAGGLVGWNHQWCNWVAGIEADFAWADIKKSETESFSAADLTLTTTLSAHQRFLGTVRARLGYNWCDTLLYVTGGLAYGNTRYGVTVSLTDLDGTTTASLSETKHRAGWTLGGGIEKMFWCNWSVKIEYLYYGFGKTHLADLPNTDWKNQIHTLRAGINYHF